MHPVPSGIHISRRLEPEPTSVAQARGALEPLEPAVDPGTFETLRLLVSELVTLGVCNGSSETSRGLELSVVASREKIRVEVLAPDAGSSPTTRAATMDTGVGTGLDVVEALSDRCGCDRHDGTSLWCELADSGAFAPSGVR